MSPPLFGTSFGIVPFLFFGAVLAGIAAVVYFIAAFRPNRDAWEDAILKGKRTPGQLPYPVEVTLGYDGFWLKGPSVPLGAIITFVYVAGTISKAGRVRYAAQANGHFVYTGAKPDRVEVLRIFTDDNDDSDVTYLPTADSTDFSTPAAAWYATQGNTPDNTPVERADPPAY